MGWSLCFVYSLWIIYGLEATPLSTTHFCQVHWASISWKWNVGSQAGKEMETTFTVLFAHRCLHNRNWHLRSGFSLYKRQRITIV